MREPFLKAVVRAGGLAMALGAVFLVALPRHASLASDFVDAFTLAFCFTLLGPYVDRVLLALPGIRVGAGPLVRAAGWFAGGLWCYVIGRWLWIRYGRDLAELPGLVWGGVLLLALQPILNRLARPRG